VNNISLDLTGSSNKQARTSNKDVYSDNALLVVKHYNSIENKDTTLRSKSRILYMRNFNNWIKSMLMKLYRNDTYGSHANVLDMCCGKGGDLFKWKNMNIRHLICADLAEVTMQHCEHRYKNMLQRISEYERHSRIFTAEFIIADCTKVRLKEKFKDPNIKLDLVSCQFAFHYCFESLEQAECMIKNASECLKPGGYFIGTIPDAYDLVWQKCDGDSFGNEIYNVNFCCDKAKPPLFGAKYHFQLEGVVNCPEFLVYLPVFCKLALKFGLKLILFERFGNFYKRMKDRGELLLKKIEALESYSPHSNVPLVGKADQDYQHVKEYIKKSPNCPEIGTLSQPEWEVTC
ncbi:mRNA cap guanine-N7 methyltransferase, partial [Eufriesea mexicana]